MPPPAATIDRPALRRGRRSRLPRAGRCVRGHFIACPRTGSPPCRGFVQVAREAVGAEGRVVPQQWLARTTAPGVAPADRRRLDLVVYGATPGGEALCCDATLALTRAGRPLPGADARDGTALAAAPPQARAISQAPAGGLQRIATTRRARGGGGRKMGRGVPALRPPAAAPPRSKGACDPMCHSGPGVGTTMVGPTLGRRAKGSCSVFGRCRRCRAQDPR